MAFNMMKKEYLFSIIAGIVLLIIGASLVILKVVEGEILMVIFNAGTVLIVIAVAAHIRYGKGVSKDERTRAIGARALSYSWLLTFILVNVLFWMDRSGSVIFSIGSVLGIIMFTMVISAVLMQFFLKIRGV